MDVYKCSVEVHRTSVVGYGVRISDRLPTVLTGEYLRVES